MKSSTVRASSKLAQVDFGAVRAVTFDVGGTLMVPWPTVGHVYAAAARDFGFGSVDVPGLNAQFARVWECRAGFDYTQAAWARLVDATFAGLIPRPPSETFFPELYRRFSLPGAWRLLPGARRMLAALRRRGYRLGIVSNWDDRLPGLLDALGLTPCFDAITISCTAGAAKPSGRIFQCAQRALQTPPAQLLHIGDSAHEDITGARRAGWHALRLAPGKTSGRGIIRSLGELAALLPPLR